MKALRMFIWMLLLTGLIYPLLVTALGFFLMPKKAQGSLVIYKGKIIGSVLIGQKFESGKYFWPRPSAVDYNPLPSGGSNLGPTSAELQQQVEKRHSVLVSLYKTEQIPSELLFASGSGLDPHITPEAAYFQMERVSKERGIESKKLKVLIDSLTQKRRFGFLGVKYINVLMLNLALDQEEDDDTFSLH